MIFLVWNIFQVVQILERKHNCSREKLKHMEIMPAVKRFKGEKKNKQKNKKLIAIRRSLEKGERLKG